METRTCSPNSRETDCRHALANWLSAMHGGQTARRLEHPQSTPRAWPDNRGIGASGACERRMARRRIQEWSGPAVSAAGLIQRRSRHPPVSGGTKHPNAGSACCRFLEALCRYANIVLRARMSAIVNVLSLTFLSNVVAYVCRVPPGQDRHHARSPR